MEYIMEATNILKHNKNLQTTNIYVKQNSIYYMKDSPFQSSTKTTKMNLSSYLLTPGHVMLLDNIDYMPFSQFKTYMTENYLRKGCTTLVSLFQVEREREFASALKKARSNLLNSPLDYYYAVRIPLKKLTPSLVRQCRRYKIAAIFLEMDEGTSISALPWGWIKDALYQFPITFLPCWKKINSANKSKKKKEWKKVMKQERLSHSEECPAAGFPLSIDLLMKIGIYPTKGDLRVGGELDYNLYVSPEGHIIETIQNLNYDSHIPEVTVHKGTIIKTGESFLFRPGFGKECTVTVPGHFLLEENERR
ncbi:hypothetical protein [Sutcliffiella rhizosphaerae]|uniref:Uncharacterized protein n=1 Tax=Sutcliffiella rhizosphaerae TaxID=2880967 RepID=A0ABN8ABR4_9BACI|nr:hypothetical protein [Sutcliffiella rhizosphaerae]CAG9622644.1 hypothetical protein BACCIP111883_03435 [Sutcliffiella rhizosphaerae]